MCVQTLRQSMTALTAVYQLRPAHTQYTGDAKQRHSEQFSAMDETKEIKEQNVSENVKEEENLDTVKEKTDTDSWGYAVGFGTIITFVSIVYFLICRGKFCFDYIASTSSNFVYFRHPMNHAFFDNLKLECFCL